MTPTLLIATLFSMDIVEHKEEISEGSFWHVYIAPFKKVPDKIPSYI